LLDHARVSIGGGQAWAALLVILLTFTIARSTVTAGWVRGIDAVTLIALVAAVLMGILALLPIPWPPALTLGTLGGAAVSIFAAWPYMHAQHPDDVIGEKLLVVWWGRISDGSAAGDPSFYLLLITLLMWVTGGWLSWCVLRWRKPLLGLIPGAAAFATNVLNSPDNQNGYTLAMLVLTLALLLWTNYIGSVAGAHRANVKLTGDARWDFWESGLVAMAGLIVLAIMLPPLSTSDRTVDLENSMFSGWAQIQQRINHPGMSGVGRGGVGTTGFSTDVKLSGPLLKTRDVVFIYTAPGFTGTRYFRGVNATATFGGEWRYPSSSGLQQVLPKNQEPSYGETYQKLALSIVDVTMRRPPTGNEDIIFYPGEIFKTDRVTVANQVPVQFFGQGSTLWTVDRLSSIQPNSSYGNYKVVVGASTATIDDLRSAGTAYPDWVKPYSSVPKGAAYRNPGVMQKIHDLALRVTKDANAITPYDQATAIENYLRSDQFTYTLTPPPTSPGMDPMDFFLFVSHKAYCEYFATAMGDMLRSLGIPTRLVNGYGPGNFDSTVNAYVVRGEDAHTWVEAYFPSYGWIQFEPTRDVENSYQPIPRGTTGGCIRENGCSSPSDPSNGSSGGVAPPIKNPRGEADPGQGSGGFAVKVPDAGTLTTVLGVLVAILLLLLAAVSRYLRPRTVMGVWKRMLVLAHMAGAERRPGETPNELSQRLQQEFPEASEPVSSLAKGFAVAAYAPPGVASTSRSSVMESWSVLRPMLLRRVLARLKPR
jgi:transglutaminase-like putative cysteine protease